MSGRLQASWRPAAGLAVAMGVGRFVYTPILPAMTAALSMPGSHGSWIAAANYLGYLLGAGALTRRPDWTNAVTLRAGLVATVILLAAMPVWDALGWFILLRLLAGVASAVVFVCIAQGVPAVELRGGAAGLVYAGVGAGIALSGAAVGLAGAASWQVLWLVAAVGAAVLAVVAWQVEVPETSHQATSDSGRKGGAAGWRLTVTYLLEGIGYIIIGTYLVALVAETTGPRPATWVWVAAGLAAVPSPLLWGWLSHRFGTPRALLGAYLLQVLSALVPVLLGGVAGGYLGAALFGATFMGITQMTIALAHQLGLGAARLTLVYAVGQLLGPVLVAALSGYGTAFLVAAVLLAVAAIMTGRTRRN